METQKPATPAQAATPGSGPQDGATPSSTSPAPTNGDQGKNPEGSVTIPLKEYRDLQRSHARALSFEKRKEFVASKNNHSPSTNFPDNADPDLVETINRERAQREEITRELHRERVTNQVRNILDKPEYAGLPKSTRDLILKNPAMLSDAQDVEEALLDIEDFVREQSVGYTSPAPQPSPANQDPSGHETPPRVTVGAPAPVDSKNLEDVTNLRGVERSRAILRNSIKKQNGAA